MNKIETIKREYLDSRKSGDSITKNLLSTFIGEYDNQAKDPNGNITTSDELVHSIAKKMIKSAETIGSEVAKQEIQILEKYLPQMASKAEIIEFLRDNDLSLGCRLIGSAKQHFGGNVDPKMVQEAIKELS